MIYLQRFLNNYTIKLKNVFISIIRTLTAIDKHVQMLVQKKGLTPYSDTLPSIEQPVIDESLEDDVLSFYNYIIVIFRYNQIAVLQNYDLLYGIIS